MNREIALDYIEEATHKMIKTRIKYDITQDFDFENIKDDIEHHDKVMKYIEENLK